MSKQPSQRLNITDDRIGALAVASRVLASQQLKECLEIQDRVRVAGEDSRLGEIFVKKNYLTREQVGKLLAWQKRLRNRYTGKQKPVQPRDGRKESPKLGKYTLLAEIGRGSMGAVYLSKSPESGRKVAIKVLPKKLAEDSEFLERFRREAKMCMELEHPNIVKGLDLGFDKGYHFMVLEYIDGPSLDKRLKREIVFDYEEALFIIRGIADALRHAGRKGVIHRDIKPDNIMIASDGTPKLTDMGLSLAKNSGDARLTMAGMAVGTPYYISPEQARGERDIDTRSDIYSLGATIYHLVTGSFPFDAKTSVQVMLAHVKEKLTPPRRRNKNISPELDALIMKMMEKKPADRFQTPEELIGAIDCVIRGEMPPGVVRRRTRPDRLERTARRRPQRRGRTGKAQLSTTMMSVVLVVLVVLIIAALLLMVHLRSSRGSPTVPPAPAPQPHPLQQPLPPSGAGQSAGQPAPSATYPVPAPFNPPRN